MCARSFSRKGQQLPDAKGHARPAHRSHRAPARPRVKNHTFSRIRRGPASPPRATARAETPRARRDAIGRGRRSARASAVARRSRPDGSRHARPLALRASPHGAREWVVRGTQAAAGVPGACRTAARPFSGVPSRCRRGARTLCFQGCRDLTSRRKACALHTRRRQEPKPEGQLWLLSCLGNYTTITTGHH